MTNLNRWAPARTSLKRQSKGSGPPWVKNTASSFFRWHPAPLNSLSSVRHRGFYLASPRQMDFPGRKAAGRRAPRRREAPARTPPPLAGQGRAGEPPYKLLYKALPRREVISCLGVGAGAGRAVHLHLVGGSRPGGRGAARRWRRFPSAGTRWPRPGSSNKAPALHLTRPRREDRKSVV